VDLQGAGKSERPRETLIPLRNWLNASRTLKKNDAEIPHLSFVKRDVQAMADTVQSNYRGKTVIVCW
jgi:hypothetical protein